jgi:hypothetical protein
MDPAKSDLGWGSKWNQTADLTYDGTNNMYTVKDNTWDKGGGTWGVPTSDMTSRWFGMNNGDTISNWVQGWTDNFGQTNITVSDTNKTYDIYFSREADQDWGFAYYFAVKESGSPAPTLK